MSPRVNFSLNMDSADQGEQSQKRVNSPQVAKYNRVARKLFQMY